MLKTEIESPVGILHAFANEEGLCGLLWPGIEDHRFDFSMTNVAADIQTVFLKLTQQLKEYFGNTRKQFDIPLAPQGTEFQLDAWKALQEIPFGQTRTYSEQAAIIGRPKAVRAIGAANGKNPISIVIPCHRVIGANGSLTGFAGGIEVKRFLLDHESNTLFSKTSEV